MKTVRKNTAWGPWVLIVFFIVSCQTDDRAFVVGKIKNASDLATTEFVIDKIVYGSKTRTLAWFKLNETNFLAYSQAVVKTGIDLNQIKENDIIIDGDKIVLKLPSIEVINFSYPPASFVEDSLVSNTRAFLNTINIRDQEEFFRLAELDIRANLGYMGLVKTSQNHTRQMFHALLTSLGYKEIYISFDSDNLIISEVNLLSEQIREGN